MAGDEFQTEPASEFDPLCGLFNKYGGATQLDRLMEKFTQHEPAPEDEDDDGDDELGQVARRAKALSQTLATQDDEHPLPPSIVRAGSQLSSWLDGYFTDPICGLKGIMVVTLFEAMDGVLLDDVEGGEEAWDASGFADMAVVRALTEGGLMDGLSWGDEDDGARAENTDAEADADLSSLDLELRQAYPKVYDVAYEDEDGAGYPSVSWGPQAACGVGQEEETCEKDDHELGILPPMRDETAPSNPTQPTQPTEPTQLLEVVEDVPGGVGAPIEVARLRRASATLLGGVVA